MNPRKSPPPAGAHEEVSSLVETLQGTERRLEELTAGEDTVTDRVGRTLVLRRAQERRRTQVALAQSEAGLHRAQFMAKLAHVITGPDGSFEQWSETLPQLVGVGPDQLPRTTRAWLDLIHPDDRALFRDTAIAAGVEKRHMELEYRLRRIDGEWMHVRQTMEPLEDEGDASAGSRWFNTLQDVTTERRTEESLRESERRFSDLLGNVQMLSVMVDRDARISYCNDYLLQLTGYRREEVIGFDWFERFIGAPTVPKANFAVLLANQPDAMHRDSEILTRSGERRLIRWNNSVLRSGAGDVIGTASIGEDITDQKRAEIKIKRLNRVYAVLSGINTLIVRVRDRGELFREACRIAAEAGQFPLAWVAVADPHDQRVKAVAWAGDERGFLQLTRPTAGVKGLGKAGLSAQAIEKRIPVVCNDIEVNGSAMRYAKGALERGYRSAAAFPLVVGGTAIGTLVLYAAEAGFFDDEEMKLLVELADDISFALDHIEKEEKVTRLTRVHAVLTGINTLIVRVRDRDELFREACRIAVEHGQFKIAWIGVVDRSAMKIALIASTGVDADFFEDIQPRMSLADDSPAGHGPAATAVRSRQPVVVNDIEADPRIRSSKAHADRGIRSLVSLPLLIGDQAVAVIVLHAAEPGFFDDEEMKLLTELAGNIAFAIDHIDKQEKVTRLTRVHAMLSGINTLVVRVRDRDELFREACRIAVEHGRFKMAWIGLVDRSAMKIVPIASAGADPEFLTLIKDSFSLRADAPLGNTMSAQVVNEKKAVVTNDLRRESKVLFAKERVARGIFSMTILPLLVSGDAVGILALYAGETGFFDEEEMKLLTELVGNIAFAIDNIDKQERLDYLAYYDVLTGLANRRLFLERVAQYMRSAVSGGHKLALFLIDLERFRNINDELGRPAGDALLRQVAEWLTQNLGDGSLLARVGADHFAVVLPEVTDEGDVAPVLEKTIQNLLDHPFRLDDTTFRIAAKFGVALFPDDGGDADTLVKNAEAALKKAKASGDRYLFYTQKMTAAVAGKLTLENQLRQALDKEEFVLRYQPKVNFESGMVTGAEALIRWNDPRTGLVPPGRFIPILEETGLIHEVGRWALRKAIADYLRWRNAGLAAVRIAVNVSALQLRNRAFVAEIEQAIGTDAHAAAELELEITESMIMDDVKQGIATLQAIRAMGVSIAIDDFGTGFSSLGYLSKLPVDTLKVDRSFVTDMTSGPQGLALVSTIINLAHSLKLNVVAEGVETEEQSRLLRVLNCDEMQGFLFSKPVPIEVFESRFLIPPAAGSGLDPAVSDRMASPERER
jgi:diguanylate cyclase (GGDEF)-like protein/PAS domain S-box-containing protein